MTVQEWVAALPDTADTDTKEESEEEEGGAGEGAELGLGAEAGSHAPQPCVAKLLLARRRHPARPLTHSDTAASFRSTASHLSVSRLALTIALVSARCLPCCILNISNNITQCPVWTRPCCSPAPRTRRSCSTTSASGARTSSPGQLSLVKRCRHAHLPLVRIPARFLRHKSAARGVTVESFIARQEDEDTRYCSMLYCISWSAKKPKSLFGYAHLLKMFLLMY